MDTAVDAFNYVISWLAVIGLFFVFLLIGLVIIIPLRSAWRERRRHNIGGDADGSGTSPVNDADLR